MKKTPVITAILFLGISLLAFIESSGMKKHLSLADQFTPLSPDKYLKILGAMIAFVTILYLGKEIFFTPHPATQISQIKFHDLLAALGIFIGYIAFIPWLGYILGTFLFYFLFLRFVGRYSYPKTLMISIIITLCMELIFAKALQIVVPTGILDFWVAIGIIYKVFNFDELVKSLLSPYDFSLLRKGPSFQRLR